MLLRYARGLRTAATLGIAAFGPLAVLSSLIVVATAWSGVPGWVAFAALVTVPTTFFAVGLYLAVELSERYQGRTPSVGPAEPEPHDTSG